MIKLFDNKTKTIKELIFKNKINIYLCGPTVYDYLHIGNIRNIIIFDCLYKLLKELKYDVKFVENITDIDDKIINKAIKNNTNEKEISKKYIFHFLNLLKIFNIKKPKLIKVTDNIFPIIKMIEKLIFLNKAYIFEDGIYFDISSDKGYGRFKKTIEFKNLNKINNKKTNDFVIWKFKTKGKTWKSPWGQGRPGWHIECAVIINENFNKNLSIHGGGTDLLFPHHENEFAILDSVNKKFKDTIWLHNGFIKFESSKISKSKLNSNVFLVKEILKKYSTNTLKLFFYFTNYQNDINFSWEHLNFCEELEKKIKTTLKRVRVKKILKNILDTENFNKNSFNDFIKVLSNNLNTIKCLDIIFKEIKIINNIIDSDKKFELLERTNSLKKMMYILGIDINFKKITIELKNKLFEWKKYILNKNFKKADLIRKFLQEKNIL